MSFYVHCFFIWGAWYMIYFIMQMMKKLRQLLEFLFLECFCFFLKTLSPEVSVRIGRVAGGMAYYLCRKRAAMGSQNLERAFPEKLTVTEKKNILKKLFRNVGEVFIESVIFRQKDVVENISVEGMQFLDEAVKNRRGLIVLIPHFGVWEIAGHVFGYYLNNASTIYKSVKNPYINRRIVQARIKGNFSLIPSKKALRPVLKKLNNGYAVGILFDQNAGRSGIVVDFFKQPTLTYNTPAVFAIRTGCVVLSAYMVRQERLRKHKLIIGKPFDLIRTGDEERDIILNTQKFNDFLEKLVRQNPEGWFGWLHNRWKFPKGVKSC